MPTDPPLDPPMDGGLPPAIIQVCNDTDFGVSGASVSLENNNSQVASGTTDMTGNYTPSITPTPSGTDEHKVSVVAGNESSQFLLAAYDDWRRVKINLPAPAANTQNAQAPAAGANTLNIDLTVVDSNNAAVNGATVKIWVYLNAPPSYTLTTNTNGQVQGSQTFSIQPGTAIIEVTAPGKKTVKMSADLIWRNGSSNLPFRKIWMQ